MERGVDGVVLIKHLSDVENDVLIEGFDKNQFGVKLPGPNLSGVHRIEI